MIQRGKDILGQGARSVTPHMTQPNIQGQPQRGALRLAGEKIPIYGKKTTTAVLA